MTLSREDFPTPGLPEGEFVELPGRGTTFMRDNKRANAPALLLLHGWTVNAALNFYGLFAHLTDDYRLIALDHRGHGRGLRNEEKFRLDDCADDAAALLDDLEIENAIVLGYSMGGAVAQLLWDRHRQKVNSLVLCSTASRFGQIRNEQVMGGIITAASAVTRRTPLSLRTRLTERVLVSKYDDTPLGHFAREQARQNDLHAIIEAGHEVAVFDFRQKATGIDVPAAAVVTTRDETVPMHRQLQMANAIPDCEIFRIEARHDACVTRPERFNDAVSQALVSVRQRSAQRPSDSARLP